MSKPIITGVLAEELQAAWPHIAHWFGSFSARSRGEVTAGELVRDVLAKRRQCWVAIIDRRIRACALTTVLDNPKKTVVLDFCAGEGRHDWRDTLVAEIEAWARHHVGAQRLRIVCRPGWTREVKALGYRETHRVLEKDLGNGQEQQDDVEDGSGAVEGRSAVSA